MILHPDAEQVVIQMGFSENLKAIRCSKKMSQQQLAERIGVYRQSIIEWEKPDGKRPEFDSLVWLHEALGVSWNKLMADETPKDMTSDASWEKVAPLANVMSEWSRKVDTMLGFEQKANDE